MRNGLSGAEALDQSLWLQVAEQGFDPRAVWDWVTLAARPLPGEAGEAEATTSPSQPTPAQTGSN